MTVPPIDCEPGRTRRFPALRPAGLPAYPSGARQPDGFAQVCSNTNSRPRPPLCTCVRTYKTGPTIRLPAARAGWHTLAAVSDRPALRVLGRAGYLACLDTLVAVYGLAMRPPPQQLPGRR